MLTKRQRDVAALVAEGWTSQEIADRFAVSKSNIDNIIYDISKKLGCKRRTQMVRILTEQKIIHQTAA